MGNIPEMVKPSIGSTAVFVAIVVFVAVSIVVGIWRGGSARQSAETRRRWGIGAALAMIVWLAIGALVPFSGILETKMMPPPAMIVVGICLLTAFTVAFSNVGRRLASSPIAALIGFQAFRLPLELVLHNWYDAGTLPVQMTFEGHNFDIVTGILAFGLAAWAWRGSIPRPAIWLFALVGTGLLVAVMAIAITSSPLPVRLYMNEPPVLLLSHPPYSWIVSVAVTGALIGHLVLFRKLICEVQAGPENPSEGD